MFHKGHDPGILPVPSNSDNQHSHQPRTYASIARNIYRSAKDNKLSADVIWHRTLNQGAVVFDLSNTSLALDEEEAMDIIGDNFSFDISGLKALGYKKSAFELNFKPESREYCRRKAMFEGIEVDGITIYAQDTYAFGSKLTKVKLRDLPLCYSEEDLVRVLRQGMGVFGEVRSVFLYERKTKRNKFFSGEGFVLLDKTPKSGVKFAELAPFIHVPEWEITISAHWEDAPLACRYCKQTGHVIKECPRKTGGASTMRTCFHCKSPGHLRAECPELAQNIPKTNQSQESERLDQNNSTVENSLENHVFQSQIETSQDEPLIKRSKQKTRKNTSQIKDSGASIHAPKQVKVKNTILDVEMLTDDSDDGDYEPPSSEAESHEESSSQKSFSGENDDIMQDYLLPDNNVNEPRANWHQTNFNIEIPVYEDSQTRSQPDMAIDEDAYTDRSASPTF
jgi:hypothetical protein